MNSQADELGVVGVEDPRARTEGSARAHLSHQVENLDLLDKAESAGSHHSSPEKEAVWPNGPPSSFLREESSAADGVRLLTKLDRA